MEAARTLSSADHQKFQRFHSRVDGFVKNVLCAEEIDLDHYILGSRRIEYYLARLEDAELDIADNVDAMGVSHSYEEALYYRLVDPHSPNVLILIGGLGAGKSTAVRYIEHLLAKRNTVVKTAFPCKCRPTCLRQPIKINAVSMRRETPPEKLHTGILRSLRFAIYNRLIDEWLTRNFIEPERIRNMDIEYEVLRRLLISNDICGFAGAERPTLYPVNIHSETWPLINLFCVLR